MVVNCYVEKNINGGYIAINSPILSCVIVLPSLEQTKESFSLSIEEQFVIFTVERDQNNFNINKK